MADRKYNYQVDTPKAIRRILEHLDGKLDFAVDSDHGCVNLVKIAAKTSYFRPRTLGDVLGFRTSIIDLAGWTLFIGLGWIVGYVLPEYMVQAWTVAAFLTLIRVLDLLEQHRQARVIVPKMREMHLIEEAVAGNIDPLAIYAAVPFPFNAVFLGAKPTSIEESVTLLVSNLDWFVARPPLLIRWTWIMMPLALACFPLVQLDIPGGSAVWNGYLSIILTAVMFAAVRDACSRRRYSYLAIAVGWLERRYILEFHDNT